jgi:hypothetical protein
MEVEPAPTPALPTAWEAVAITPAQAAFSGDADVLKGLLDAGGAGAAATADPVSGMTPLMLAALKGHLSCAAQLIDAAPEALSATDALGRTVLMLAATGGSVEVIHLLHKHGAQIDATSRDGRTALIWAVIAHKYWAVEALALLGADPELRELQGSGLMKPGGEDPPKSAWDHAKARHGKDPVLGHLRAYFKGLLKAREEGTAIPKMEEPGWIVHAKKVAAGEAEEEVVAEVSTGGGGADGEGDIWDEGDEAAEEEAAAVGLTAAAAKAVAAGEAVEGFTPCGSFEGARPGKVFKSGAAGVGYYDETVGEAKTEPAVPAGEAKAAAAKKVQFKGEAEVAATPTPPAAKADLDELD